MRGGDGGGETIESVKDYYGKVLATTKDLKTSACTAGGKPHARIIDIINTIPNEVNEKFYGCGAPLPMGVEGLRVLDLGSGSGRDCYVMAALVGEEGSVIGLDMTAEQLSVARAHHEGFCTKTLGYKKSNLKFVEGYIERIADAGIAPESVDLVISNCVVNLSPDKPRVLKEVFDALVPGGEFYFSDVYCDRRLPLEVQKHEVLWGECIAGALYTNDFIRHARAAGYRLFKLPGQLETLCEDYGQAVKYKGTIKGQDNAYRLDDGHLFEKNKIALVCGNSAAMLGEGGVSWLAKHFEIIGDRAVHYGEFPCHGPPAPLGGDPTAVFLPLHEPFTLNPKP
ncbi:S-adenosyl-L-methionine-dependent methyltransferase [Baffinella frigidus]|nr:S-adenosyl-L-methionine-dependent methyltransferase [Cryptophyta sp. CCMP2293]